VNRYFAIFKPMNMLSQFSKDKGSDKSTLADLAEFPKDVYPVGRLDADSEGLLILTNDKTLTERLLNPKNKHGRTYLIQVEGDITNEALDKLRTGVGIRIKKENHVTAPAIVSTIDPPDWLPERSPPVRFRANIQTSWVELTITEGRNRQVRRMTAAVGFPTLRLIRTSINRLSIHNVHPSTIVEFSQDELIAKLF
jgi:23S rRNA pseudouridine2457 synthase